MRNVHRTLISRSEGKRPIVRSWRRSEDNVKKLCEDADWIHLAQDRDQRRALVNTVMNLSVP
jgi:hypothetical protein